MVYTWLYLINTNEYKRGTMFFIILNTEEDVIFVEKLYNKYSKFMYKVAFGILKNQYDSEDSVQQTFLKLIDKYDKLDFSDERRTRNLIGIICRNVSFNIYNKDKKDDYTGINTYSPNFDLSVIIISKDNVNKVMEFIYGMDDIYREVVLLKSQDLSVAEISDILNIKPKTVQKRLERARIKIIEFLDKEKNNG